MLNHHPHLDQDSNREDSLLGLAAKAKFHCCSVRIVDCALWRSHKTCKGQTFCVHERVIKIHASSILTTQWGVSSKVEQPRGLAQIRARARSTGRAESLARSRGSNDS